MITFRLAKQDFKSNTFITSKDTPISKTLNKFGYIKTIDRKGNAIVWWYSNYIKAEIRFNIKELLRSYKSIYPYYNTSYVRGNIWKHSYCTLLQHIHPDKGFSQIKVDKLTYRIHVKKGNDVIISNARRVLEFNLTTLEGKVLEYGKDTFRIKTSDGIFCLNRCDFEVLPQDYFILLSVRCKQ